jgi:predicted RNA-binding protein
MNYLVILEARAGELEKILSGVKSMVIKEFIPEPYTDQPIKPGDSLYFLRNNAERDLRVKATVVGTFLVTNNINEDLSRCIKEMQPRLQLTEEQYAYWSTKKQVLLVEFEAAQKIGVIHLALDELKARSNWIAFEAFSILTSEMFQ